MESESENSAVSDAEGAVEASVDDVIEGQFEVNSQGKLVKPRNEQPKYTQREMVVIWHFFENRYTELYGTGKGSNIAYSQNVVWQEFARAVDEVEQGTKKRTVKRVWKKIDNMKFRGRSLKLVEPLVGLVVPPI